MTSLLEAHGDEANADARRSPALWEGRTSLGGMLAAAAPATIAVGLFFGGVLVAALQSAGAIHHATIRIWGKWIPLDPSSALLANLITYALFLIVFLVFLYAFFALAVRPLRNRFRVEGTAVEMAAGGVIDRIAIADIHRVAVHWMGGWHLVRVIGADRRRIDMFLGTRDAMRVLSILRGMGVKCGAVDAVEMPSGAVTLALGEPVRWRGRPGLASFDAARAIAAIGLSMPLLILVLTLVWIWSAQPPLLFGLFWSAFVFSLFGYLGLYLLSAFHERFRVWLYDAFGAVVVTDRRIAWCALGSGAIYRDLPLAQLVEAHIVERKGRRAWVALLVRAGGGVRDVDLRGIPDADSFIAALGLHAR